MGEARALAVDSLIRETGVVGEVVVVVAVVVVIVVLAFGVEGGAAAPDGG